MMHKLSKHCFTAFVVVWACVAPTPRGHVTPSGLSNIPTADTAPDRTVVFQAFTNLGADRKPEYITGFKLGLRPWGQRFEGGLDGKIASGDAGPALYQAKYVLQPGFGASTWALFSSRTTSYPS
jgi:hypothetical protein